MLTTLLNRIEEFYQTQFSRIWIFFKIRTSESLLFSQQQKHVRRYFTSNIELVSTTVPTKNNYLTTYSLQWIMLIYNCLYVRFTRSTSISKQPPFYGIYSHTYTIISLQEHINVVSGMLRVTWQMSSDLTVPNKDWKIWYCLSMSRYKHDHLQACLSTRWKQNDVKVMNLPYIALSLGWWNVRPSGPILKDISSCQGMSTVVSCWFPKRLLVNRRIWIQYHILLTSLEPNSTGRKKENTLIFSINYNLNNQFSFSSFNTCSR